MEAEIKKIKDALNSKYTPEFAKEKLRAKLAELEAKKDIKEEAPKAKKEKSAPKAKADKKPTAKKETPSDKPKKSGNNVLSYAKKIQKEGESWKDAVKRASKELKNGGKPAKKIKKSVTKKTKPAPVAKKIKKSVTKKTKSVAKPTPKKIKKVATKSKKKKLTSPRVIKRYKYLTGSTSVEADKSVKALPPGKRKSASGNIYYESRANRADLNRTKKLAKGGELDENEYYEIYGSLKSGFDLYSTNGEESSETFIGNYETLGEAKEIAKQKGLEAKPMHMRYAKGGSISDIPFENSNLYLYGFGRDTNGNTTVKVGFPNRRAFTIQTNGNLNFTHSKRGEKISSLEQSDINKIEKEVVDYVKEYGSKEQKRTLKIFNN